MVLKELINKGRNRSSSSQMNYLAEFGNVVIMDNHLAAILYLDELGRKGEAIEFIHVDRHYDLGEVPRDFERYLNLDLPLDISLIENFNSQNDQPFFLWDNYIHLAGSKYKGLFKYSTFITHINTHFVYPFSEYEISSLYQLISYSQNDPESKKILNIDIDYFFHVSMGNKYYLTISDELLELFAQWLQKNKPYFEKIFIALSPECCGTWENSVNITNRILESIGIQIDI